MTSNTHSNLLCISLLLSFTSISCSYSGFITIIGTGYVGLVTGVGLAEVGNTVICSDIDSNKIKQLKEGKMPIYEPELQKLVESTIKNGRLIFTNDVDNSIKKSDVIFIAVGTPMTETGQADISSVESVVEMISAALTDYKLICVKSTVPIGTGEKIKQMLESKGIDPTLYDIVSNPEFLREGSAVNDFLYPDRIVVGADSERARTILKSIYKSFDDNGIPIIYVSRTTSETIKYASNAFLAIKLSYINEIANLCDAVGADVKDVAYAMGLDNRIGPGCLCPGPGFGGSCLPKDSNALLHIAKNKNVPMRVVTAALEANEHRKIMVVEKLKKLLIKTKNATLFGKSVAVLGLAFKANTDDVRCSPAIKIIELLLKEGVFVKAYDPYAMENMQKLLPTITYCKSAYEAVENVDAFIIMTEWDEFKNIDLNKIASKMKQKIVVDARNILNLEALKVLGFQTDTLC